MDGAPSDSHPLDLLLRVFASNGPRYEPKGKAKGWSAEVLVMDTETTTDPSQRLLFGSYQFGRWAGERVTTLKEGLFVGDDVRDRDPKGFYLARHYAELHDLAFMTRTAFIETEFWRAAYLAEAMVVGFNLPFDLSRLAIAHADAKGASRGGFSFTLWPPYWDEVEKAFKENRYRPRLAIKHLDPKRSFIGFRGRKRNEGEKRTRGRFLDLRTLTHALTGEAYSLRSACKAFRTEVQKGNLDEFGVISRDAIDYNREDVSATRSLLERARQEFDGYPVGSLDPCKTYSPASIAKSAFREMGFSSPMKRLHGSP